MMDLVISYLEFSGRCLGESAGRAAVAAHDIQRHAWGSSPSPCYFLGVIPWDPWWEHEALGNLYALCAVCTCIPRGCVNSQHYLLDTRHQLHHLLAGTGHAFVLKSPWCVTYDLESKAVFSSSHLAE